MANATTNPKSDSPYKKLLDQMLNYGQFSFGQQGELDEAAKKAKDYGTFTYDKQGTYDELLGKVINPEEYSYDPEKDPLWSSYRKAYLREGDRAAQDMLAKTSIATGGVPSSYAVTAATQAQNYYNGQLMDKLPALEQNAYQRYLGGYNQLLQGFGAIKGDRDTEYGKWMDGYEIAQRNYEIMKGERDTEYGKWKDEYDLLRGNTDAAKEAESSDYTKQQNAYTDLVTLITTTGHMPDAATLAAAGMTAEEAASWKAFYDNNVAKETEATNYTKQQNAYTDLVTLITTTGHMPDAATLAAAGMTAEEAASWKAFYDYNMAKEAEASKNNTDSSNYTKQQNAYSNLITLITTTGYVPDPETLAAAGMTAEEAAAWKAYYDKANPTKTTSNPGLPVVNEDRNTGNTPNTQPTTDNTETGSVDYSKLTDAELDALFMSAGADNVASLRIWLANQGVPMHKLNSLEAKYGNRNQTPGESKGAATGTGAKTGASTGGSVKRKDITNVSR